MKRVGVLGGAFDPPHNEHYNICMKAIDELRLDTLVILPSQDPPHKEIKSSYEIRLEFLKLLFKNHNNVIIDTHELYSNKINYTVDTIPYLKETYGEEIFFILGGDSIANLIYWKDPLTIVKELNLAVVPRDGDFALYDNSIEYWRSNGAKNIIKINYSPKSISSSLLRFYLSIHDERAKEFLDDKVYSIAVCNKVYGDYSKEYIELKNVISPNRLKHSIGVVEYALKLNSKLRLDERKVILAALLHDNAKSDKILSQFISSLDMSLKKKYERFFDQNGWISPVLHAFVGAERAEKVFNIKDEDIINAIRYHSTGRANMSNLEKLIYAADFLEYGRKHDLGYLRSEIENDFEEGFKDVLILNYDYLKRTCAKFDYLTTEAYEYYCK